MFRQRRISSTRKDRGLGRDANVETRFRNLIRNALKHGTQYLKIPDSRILWIPGAIIAGIIMVSRNKINALFATGPTFTSLIVGAILKKICRLPLILDFRDAWIGDPMFPKTPSISYKINNKVERYVIKSADLVISTNPFVTKDFERRYADLGRGRFKTIYNGYDEDEYISLEIKEKRRNDRMTIVHTGILYNERTPRYFLQAVRDVIGLLPEIRQEMRVIFVGRCEPFDDGKRIEDYVRDYDLEDIVELIGERSRRESLEYQVTADILLMIVGIVPPRMAMTYGIPGKIFDYMIMKKPILTIADDGAAREFITENRIGDIYHHKDIDGITKQVMRYYGDFKEGKLESRRDSCRFETYDLKYLTKCLSDSIGQILEKKR
jgi:glycosyltransferase involved in cell wall biosynthesis